MVARALIARLLPLGALCAVACREDGLRLAEELARRDPALRERLASGASSWRVEGGRLHARGELAAWLPASAQGALEVGPGESEAHRLRLAPEGARAAPARLDGGRAVYEDAYPSTDVLWVARGE